MAYSFLEIALGVAQTQSSIRGTSTERPGTAQSRGQEGQMPDPLLGHVGQRETPLLQLGVVERSGITETIGPRVAPLL